MARFAAAEKELEAEIVDVVQEANTFRQGWGGMIFATATEMAQAEKTRDTVMCIPRLKAVEGGSAKKACLREALMGYGGFRETDSEEEEASSRSTRYHTWTERRGRSEC